MLRDSNTTMASRASIIPSGSKNYLFVRYFINDNRFTNQSPLNNGFDLAFGFQE